LETRNLLCIELNLHVAAPHNSSSTCISLPSGVSEYPFQVQLPVGDFPPTMRFGYSRVSYKIHASIDRPNWLNSTTPSLEFNLSPVIPIPPHLLLPLSRNLAKPYYGGLGFTRERGKVEVALEMDKTGFLVSEKFINIQGFVRNMAANSTHVTGVSALLRQKVVLVARHQTQILRNKVCQRDVALNIKPDPSGETFVPFSLDLPLGFRLPVSSSSDPLTSTTASVSKSKSLITVTYKIKFWVKLGLLSSIDVDIPIRLCNAVEISMPPADNLEAPTLLSVSPTCSVGSSTSTLVQAPPPSPPRRSLPSNHGECTQSVQKDEPLPVYTEFDVSFM
jgi:hypothetical protein